MQNPIIFTTRLIALALLGHIVLSWPLWHAGYRLAFPVLPVFGLPFPQTDFWAALHAWLTVGICLALLWLPNRRWVLAATVAWFLWMIVQDITRLQPWMYFYLLALGLLLYGVPNRNYLSPKIALRWLLAAVYCWGGFNKMTPYFTEDNFPWFCEAFYWTKPMGAWPAAGYGVALVELLFAPGLLWRTSRPVFRWVVPGFHLFIVVALSPLGLDWNAVVIPWNVAMGGMAWVLFGPSLSPQGISSAFRNLEIGYSLLEIGYSDKEKRSGISNIQQGISNFQVVSRELIGLSLQGAGLGLLTLAWLLPLFNIFHLWPEPLSWKMYSNTQTEATYFQSTAPGSEGTLQRVWDKHAYDNGRKLLLDDWAFEELRVPVFNSRQTFIQLARYLCVQNKPPDNSGLLLLSVERWDRSAEKWETIPCAQIAR